MCRGRRARILLHLHIQLEGTVLRGSRYVVLLCLLLQYLIQSCARGGRRIVEDMCYEIQRAEACVD
jgi:hypothetical protein